MLTVKPYGPPEATVMVVGEGPSRNDLLAGRVFSGNAEKELTKLLHRAGFLLSECYITSVSRGYVSGWDSTKYFTKYTKGTQVLKPEVAAHLPLLAEEIASVKPNLIIALGELALWALTGESGITKWRGSILTTIPPLPAVKVIPTYSPEMIARKYDWSFIAAQDFKRCEKEAAFPEVRTPDYHFTIRPSFTETIATLDNLLSVATALQENQPLPPGDYTIREGKLILGGDIETRASHIACLGIAWNTLTALCIPFLCVENTKGYWNEEEELTIVLKIQTLFTHPFIGWVFQNGIYDYQYFARHWGTIPHLFMDTMLAHHTCWSGLPKGLDFISSLYCQYHRYWKDEGKAFHTGIKTPSEEELYWVYNCKDCVTMLEASSVLLTIIAQLKQEEPYAFQLRQFPVVLSMMLRGVRIDKKRKSELAFELLEALHPRETLIAEIAGHPLNPKSPKQLQDFFYGELGLPKQIDRKTKRPTTNAYALQTLATKEPLIAPLVQAIEEYRSLGVFLSTFVKASLDVDGRMRSSYNIAGTETFRWSSSKDAWGTGMNLQNIPKGSE